jgi:D-alanyl-D-alanine carboxypeptidase/D-alanyl-D-alanine-endopeptidase (penicillin-binding protein 4)
MPLSGFRGEDGSGLSELNRITAREMVHVLEAMLGHPAGRAFVDSMAISGRDGTLRSRMRDSVAMDRVRAKTGFISGVSCLSGYMTVQEFRQPLVFAMLFNQLNGGPGGARATQDRICEMVIKAYQ